MRGKYTFKFTMNGTETTRTLLLRNYFDGTWHGTLRDDQGESVIVDKLTAEDGVITFIAKEKAQELEVSLTTDGKTVGGTVSYGAPKADKTAAEVSGNVGEITPADDHAEKIQMKRKALIIYASLTGNTEKIAKAFQRTFEHYGFTVDMYKITNKSKRINFNYRDYDVVCMGSLIIAGAPTTAMIKQFSLGGGSALEENVTKNAEAGLDYNAGGGGMPSPDFFGGDMPAMGGGMPPMGEGMPPMGGGMPPMGAGGPPAGMPSMDGGMPPMGAGAPAGMPPMGGGMPSGNASGGEMLMSYAGGPAPHGIYQPLGVVFTTYGGGFYGSNEAMPVLETLKLYLENSSIKVVGKFACCGKEFGPAGLADGVKPSIMGGGSIDEPVYYKDADDNYHAGSYFFHTHMNSKPNARDIQKAEALIADLVEDYFYSHDGIRKYADSQYISIS